MNKHKPSTTAINSELGDMRQQILQIDLLHKN